MNLLQRLKKKEEGGSAESNYSFSAKHWFLWKREWLCEAPATSPSCSPAGMAHCPSIVFVWPTFLLSHSRSLPLPTPSNNTHCPRRRKKRKKELTAQHLGWIKSGYKSIQATESSALPEIQGYHFVSCLIFILLQAVSKHNFLTLFMPSTHNTSFKLFSRA